MEARLPPLESLFRIGGRLELVGGLLLLLGLFTRPVTLVISGEMAVAYWMVHAPVSPYPVLNGGDGHPLRVFPLFVFTGPGAFGVDAAPRKPRAPAPAH